MVSFSNSKQDAKFGDEIISLILDKSNLKYVYHNMRVLNHKFSGNCQFIFTGSRERSEEFIPKLLKLGKKLWNVDLQYYIDKGLI